VVDLPPGVAAGAGWISIASAITTTSAAATTTVGSSRGRCVTTGRSTTVTASIATLRCAAPASSEASAASSTAHTTDIAGCGIASTTASTTTTPAATTESRAFTSNALEEAGHFLVGLFQQIEEVPNNTTVATVEERGRNTSVSGTTSTTNAMNVVVDVGR